MVARSLAALSISVLLARRNGLPLRTCFFICSYFACMAAMSSFASSYCFTRASAERRSATVFWYSLSG